MSDKEQTKKLGRRTKLTPDVQNAIVSALRAGNYQETAARYAGIAEPTFYSWLARGRDEPDSIYGEFLEAVESAKAASEVRDIALIDKAAANGSWQAAAWKLERKYPQRWGRLTRTEITGADGGELKVTVDHRQTLRDVLGLTDAGSDDQ